MDFKIKSRREEWLKISTPVYNSIELLKGDYLSKEIQQFGRYKLAKDRISELDSERRTSSKILIGVIYSSVVFLGTTIFTVLPSLVMTEIDQDDSFLFIGKLIVGCFLSFGGHWLVSSFLKELLLYLQYESLSKQLKENISKVGMSGQLTTIFFDAQLEYLEKMEQGSGKSPSSIFLTLSVIASLLEVVAVITLLTRSGGDINPLLIAFTSFVPLLLLWVVSLITAYYVKVPPVNSAIKGKYFDEVVGMELDYSQARDYWTENLSIENSSYYIDRMTSLKNDRVERNEVIINYLIHRHKLGDRRNNEAIEIEGEIEFYKDLKNLLKEEDSHRIRYLDTCKSEALLQCANGIYATSAGGIEHNTDRTRDIILAEYKEIERRDQTVINVIFQEVETKIIDLKEKYDNLNTSTHLNDSSHAPTGLL